MNRKFILIMLVFTLTVPGFFIFSYWHLGIFSDMTVTELKGTRVAAIVRNRSGDYNKTGEEVVRVKRLLASYALPCEPVLIYFDSAITTGKPYLKSAGGCITEEKIPAHVQVELNKQDMRPIEVRIGAGYRLAMKAQTAVALRKVWTEIARITERGTELRYPLVQLVRESGLNEFYIGKGQVKE